MIRIEYGGLRVLDVQALRTHLLAEGRGRGRGDAR